MVKITETDVTEKISVAVNDSAMDGSTPDSEKKEESVLPVPALEAGLEELLREAPAEASEEIKKSAKDNVSGRKAAEETINFILEEQKDFLTKRFWEIIRDYAITQCGYPLEHKEDNVMLEGKLLKFLNEEIPEGKYEGKRVKAILRSDRDWLKRHRFEPNLFQKLLRRMFAMEEKEIDRIIDSTIKKKPKAKPKPKVTTTPPKPVKKAPKKTVKKKLMGGKGKGLPPGYAKPKKKAVKKPVSKKRK